MRRHHHRLVVIHIFVAPISLEKINVYYLHLLRVQATVFIHQIFYFFIIPTKSINGVICFNSTAQVFKLLSMLNFVHFKKKYRLKFLILYIQSTRTCIWLSVKTTINTALNSYVGTKMAFCTVSSKVKFQIKSDMQYDSPLIAYRMCNK